MKIFFFSTFILAQSTEKELVSTLVEKSQLIKNLDLSLKVYYDYKKGENYIRYDSCYFYKHTDQYRSILTDEEVLVADDAYIKVTKSRKQIIIIEASPKTKEIPDLQSIIFDYEQLKSYKLRIDSSKSNKDQLKFIFRGLETSVYDFIELKFNPVSNLPEYYIISYKSPETFGMSAMRLIFKNLEISQSAILSKLKTSNFYTKNQTNEIELVFPFKNYQLIKN
jgi:hypothetical protein